MKTATASTSPPSPSSSTEEDSAPPCKKEKKEKRKEKKAKKEKKKKRSRISSEDLETTTVDEASASSLIDANAEEPIVNKKEKKAKKEKKDKMKQHKKRSRSEDRDDSTQGDEGILSNNLCCSPGSTTTIPSAGAAVATVAAGMIRPLVESSALPEGVEPDPVKNSVTLLLFYQYVEPPWNDAVYKHVLQQVLQIGKKAGVEGRMRVAKEGLNCTLTGSDEAVRLFIAGLRQWKPGHFNQTEFKLTHHLLAEKHRFSNGLKIMPVTELVHYGLEGDKAPPIQSYSGVHLEPAAYHQKLAEPDTVVIDVRNHYEAAIGRFDPPSNDATTTSDNNNNSSNNTTAKKFLDPKMRKSTEFPVWLDSDETKEKLRGKQVLMYCTGGIRCERASALLKYKMETDPAVKELGIQGVYQLQGGIDKYFKEFPDGGYWKGKNYTFDKRFAHAPVAVEKGLNEASFPPMGKCEACSKPWDKYRGKRRCPTCGVPSLICKDCYQADQDGTKKLDKWIRCDLCVEQNVRSKKELRDKEQKELDDYETRLQKKGLLNLPAQTIAAGAADPNPDSVTRLYLRNMCRKSMTDEVLLELFPGITHIVWRIDGKTGNFFGQGWVEMESPGAAAAVVARSGETVLGRPLFIDYQPPDGKDVWPPPKSAVPRAK